MADMSPEQKERYKKIADEHATWLTVKIIKPMFIETFLHGVKHGREDVEKENQKCKV